MGPQGPCPTRCDDTKYFGRNANSGNYSGDALESEEKHSTKLERGEGAKKQRTKWILDDLALFQEIEKSS